VKRILLALAFIACFHHVDAQPGPIPFSSSSSFIAPWWSSAVNMGQFGQDAIQLDLNAFRAPGAVPLVSDDGAAWTAAYAKTAALWTAQSSSSCIYVPPPGSFVNSSVTFPGAGIPVCVHGEGGTLPSRILIGTSYPGTTVIPCDNAWENNQTPLGALTVPNIWLYTAGCSFRDLDIIGSLGPSSSFYGIQTFGKVDFMLIANVQCDYLGACIKEGDYNSAESETFGTVRDSVIQNVRAFNTGSASLAAFDFSTNCTGAGCSFKGSNDNFVDNIRSYAPLGPNVRFCNNASAGSSNQMDKWYLTDLILEQDSTATNGDNLDIGQPSSCVGRVANLTINGLVAAVGPSGTTGVLISHSGNGTLANDPQGIIIHGLQFTHSGGATGNDFDVEGGSDIIVTGETTSGSAGTNIVVGCVSGTTPGLTGDLDFDAGIGIASQSKSICSGATSPTNLVNLRNDPVYGQLISASLKLGTNPVVTSVAPIPAAASSCVSTATVTPGTLGDWSVSYGTQTCEYTKLALASGNVVFIHESITYTPTFTTASGVLHFGLPTTAANDSINSGMTISNWGTLALSGSSTSASMEAQANKTYAEFQQLKSGLSQTALSVTSLTSGTAETVWFNGFYLSQ
jgi:hypothetical protein